MRIKTGKQKSCRSVEKFTSLLLLFSLLFATFSNNIEIFHNHELFPHNCSQDDNEYSTSHEECPYFTWNANSSDQITPQFSPHLIRLYTHVLFEEKCESPSLALISHYASRAPPTLL